MLNSQNLWNIVNQVRFSKQLLGLLDEFNNGLNNKKISSENYLIYTNKF